MKRLARIEIASLGTWAGAALLAEYDPEDDAIRVDARAVAAVRTALGDAAAERFVAFAVAHERYHRMHPGAGEADARTAGGALPEAEVVRFERVLRAARAAPHAR